MSVISAIVEKELKEIIRDKNLVTGLLSVSMFLGMLVLTSSRSVTIVMSAFIPYLPLMTAFILGFSLSGRFVKEKLQGVIETVLCTPVSLRELWLAKTMSITCASSLTTMVITILVIALSGIQLTAPLVMYLLIAVPAFVFSALGLLCLLYFYLGMRQIQAVNYVIFFLLFIALSIILRIKPSSKVTFEAGIAMLTFSVILSLLLNYAVKHVDKERIVTTIG